MPVGELVMLATRGRRVQNFGIIPGLDSPGVIHCHAMISRVDDYLHAVPLSGSVPEQVGPFTLFRSTTVWPYYARPVPGSNTSIQPAEIVGVGTLPSMRRRGLAAAVTSTLAEHAFANGVDLILLSAESKAVAAVYERVGFHRLGTAGAAE
jgi:GNAT superfamily N-acetyltransferase